MTQDTLFTEAKRQLFHMFSGLAMIILHIHGILSLKLLGILIICGFILSAVYKRYRIPVISFFMDHFERPANISSFPGKGAIFYLLGCFFALLLFDTSIAYASIMIMAFGDSVSTMFSMRFQGRGRHPFSSTKHLEGALVGGIAAFLGSLLFIGPIVAFIASIIAMLIEGFDIRLGLTHIDDNLIIPIVAGALITVLQLFI